MTDYREHAAHSGLVRGWRVKQAKNSFGEDVMKWTKGPCCKLRSPHDGYAIHVTFNRYVDHPEFVRVRSTNWRAEHEANGVYRAADAEAFYRTLKRAGFVEEG